MLSGKINPENVSLKGKIASLPNSLIGAITTTLSVAYTGSYVVTPTQATQTLYTAGKEMQQNVTVNPIPSYYGLITWDGSELMVS